MKINDWVNFKISFCIFLNSGSYNYMTSTQPTNFNQPQSLVKYSNPVLVSSSGKKQIKVISLLPRITKPIMPALTLKISSTPSSLQDNTPPKNNNSGIFQLISGFSPYQQLPPPNKMSLIYNKNSIKDFSKDRPGKLVSAPSEKNCTLNALMSWSDKSPSTALKEAFFLSESEIKSDL